MNKINIENFNDLKSWPFKEAHQILKRNGGLANFKIPKQYLRVKTLPTTASGKIKRNALKKLFES